MNREHSKDEAGMSQDVTADAPRALSVAEIARTVSMLRGNIEDEDRRMAVENCNALIEYLESGEPVRDLSSARQLATAISVRIAEADGAGRSRGSLVRPLGSSLTALTEERDVIEAEARRYASHYPQASDGRNTFVMLADWIAARS